MSKAAVCDVISNTFPNGFRVLVVDGDPTCLLILAKMLQTCNYQVTKCSRAMDALSIIYESKEKFDLVIVDTNLPDIDGFRLLPIISLEMELPVVMTSSDDQKDVVMKAVMKGACDYLVKPMRLEVVRFVWQHVVRRRILGLTSLDQSKNVENNELEYNDDVFLKTKDNYRNSNGENVGEVEEGMVKDDTVSTKRPRMVWTDELHRHFVGILNQIGLKNVVPKKILELMNVPGLTRENVASHLQKYRLHLQRRNENGHNETNSFANANNNLNGIQNDVSSTMQNPFKIRRLNDRTRNHPSCHFGDLYEHTFSPGSTNASFMSDNNLDSSSNSSSYEHHVLTVEDLDQQDNHHHLRLLQVNKF